MAAPLIIRQHSLQEDSGNHKKIYKTKKKEEENMSKENKYMLLKL
jgi:hypothetical protein